MKYTWSVCRFVLCFSFALHPPQTWDSLARLSHVAYRSYRCHSYHTTRGRRAYHPAPGVSKYSSRVRTFFLTEKYHTINTTTREARRGFTALLYRTLCSPLVHSVAVNVLPHSSSDPRIRASISEGRRHSRHVVIRRTLRHVWHNGTHYQH